MKNIFTILIICILISCKENPKKETIEKESFSLKGTINGDYSDYIFLSYGNVKDSIKVLNNRFEFKGKVEKPTQGWLNLKPDSNLAWIYIENSNITIETNFKKSIKNEKLLNILNINKIEGSYSAEIQNEYKDFYQKNQSKENFKNLLYTELQTFIEQNQSHPLSGAILGEVSAINPGFSISELMELYSKIDTTYQNKRDLEMFNMGIQQLNKYGIDKQFLNFKLPNIKNQEIEISTFLDKIILVDFWASWCGPCRKNILI